MRNKEPVSVILGVDAEEPPEKTQYRVLLRIEFLILAHRELYGRKYKERAKDVYYPIKSLEEPHARAYKDAPHDYRAEDAPFQYARLIGRRYPEIFEYHYEDKDVVDA